MKFFKFLVLILLSFSSHVFAFGSGSMGGVGGVGGSGSGTSAVKSGISIVDPEGKSLNCQPFVDKKWDSTDYIDNWNGLYFAIGGEGSSFSGDMIIDSSRSNATNNNKYSLIADADINKPLNLSGSSTSLVANLGGGTLVDRVYLGSDLEIRTSSLSSTLSLNIDDYDETKTKTASSLTKFNFTVSNYVLFNAKIGYLLNDRTMAYFNAGIGSFTSYDLTGNKDYSVTVESQNIPPPIRLSVGGEYLLSNHFRVYADYSYWMIPKVYGQFRLNKAGAGMSTSSNLSSSNTIIAKLKVNSGKIGILYRF
ncbi:MAG: hypothetical protein ACO26G_02385 [Rickettsiales bacterium]